MKKVIGIIIIFIIIVVVWATTFFIVIQPMGLVPKGTTVWMFKPERIVTQKVIPFICSADGMLLKEDLGVSLVGRALVLAILAESGKIIIRLPYSHTLYLISTGGVEFGR